MKLYFKQREKSPLVKHYHQEELKRLQKQIYSIKNRKKPIFSDNKENTLPILSPRYHLTLSRQQQIKEENDRLSSRIAQTKTKQSQYFKKILKQKERVRSMQMKEALQMQQKRVKMIYSSTAANILQISFENGFKSGFKRDGQKSGVRAFTQRGNNGNKQNKQ